MLVSRHIASCKNSHTKNLAVRTSTVSNYVCSGLANMKGELTLRSEFQHDPPTLPQKGANAHCHQTLQTLDQSHLFDRRRSCASIQPWLWQHCCFQQETLRPVTQPLIALGGVLKVFLTTGPTSIAFRSCRQRVRPQSHEVPLALSVVSLQCRRVHRALGHSILLMTCPHVMWRAAAPAWDLCDVCHKSTRYREALWPRWPRAWHCLTEWLSRRETCAWRLMLPTRRWMPLTLLEGHVPRVLSAARVQCERCH